MTVVSFRVTSDTRGLFVPGPIVSAWHQVISPSAGELLLVSPLHYPKDTHRRHSSAATESSASSADVQVSLSWIPLPCMDSHSPASVPGSPVESGVHVPHPLDRLLCPT